jgi:hypothetical protein
VTVSGRIVESGSDLLDGRVQAVLEVDVGPVGPEPLSQLFSGDDLSWMLDERGQDLEGLLLDPDEVTVATERLRLQVRFKRAKADERPSRAK